MVLSCLIGLRYSWIADINKPVKKFLVLIQNHKLTRQEGFFFLRDYLFLFYPSDETQLWYRTLFPQVSPCLVQCHPLHLTHSTSLPYAECVFTKLSGLHTFPAAHLAEIKALASQTIAKVMQLDLCKRSVKNKQAKLVFWVSRKRSTEIPQGQMELFHTQTPSGGHNLIPKWLK